MENLNLSLPGEIWKPIASSPSYHVSNFGRVKSKKKILSPWNDGVGYRKVSIHAEVHKVHRLVAAAFIENPNNYPCVNHKDGDKSNNNVCNLEWCNHSQNRTHAIRIGLVKQGCDRGDSRLTLAQVISIKSDYATGNFSQRELALKHGIGKSSIQLLLTNKTYKNAV